MLKKEMLTPAERRRRQDSVDDARASIGLEGFNFSAEREEAARRYVAGEIDIQDFLSGIRRSGFPNEGNNHGEVFQTITPAGRFDRQQAVDQARATVRLEGGTVSAEREEAARRYVAGEINIDGFLHETSGSAPKT